MSIVLYRDKSTGGNPPSWEETDPIPVIDHFRLLQDCQELGIPSDWWFPLANTITIVSGYEPSVAYLLIQKRYLDGATVDQTEDHKAIPALDRERYGHRIDLMDNERAKSGLSPISIKGWAFHSAVAIDGSSNRDDINTVYLVKFVDLRFLFARRPVELTVDDNVPSVDRRGYNIVSQTRDDTDMVYDPSDPGEFPYDVPTLKPSGYPWQWDEILEDLWTQAVRGFIDQEFPLGGIYPDQSPLDIQPQQNNAWKFFCDMLHGTGNEIYPSYSGEFRIGPMDETYNDDTGLDEWSDYLIQANYHHPEHRRIPPYINMEFRNRNRDSEDISTTYPDGKSSTDWWELPTGFASTAASPGPESVNPLLDLSDITDLDANIAQGNSVVGSIVLGTWETIPTMCQSAVWKVGGDDVDPNNANGSITWLNDFAEVVLTRYLKARIQRPVNNTYGYFINQEPDSFHEKVSYWISPNGPCTCFESTEPSIVPSFIQPIDNSGSGADDHTVFANTTGTADQTPDGFYEKVNDHITWDSELYVPVYADVVVDSGSPRNNKVRLFAPVGLGEPGPPGADGATGATGPAGADGDTVDEGYAIDVTHAGTVATVAFDPTELHNYNTNFFQFYAHRQNAIDAQDRWTSITNYRENFAAIGGLTGQFIQNLGSDVFEFRDTFNYSAGADQLLFSASNVWRWKTTSNYIDAVGSKQLLGQIEGQWTWKKLEDWLKYLGNFDHTKHQVVGHDAAESDDAVAVVWQDVGTATVNSPTSIELNLLVGSLESKLNVTQYTFGVVGTATTGSSSMNDSVPVDNC